MALTHGPKNNSRKRGIPQQQKELRRKQALERQAKYDALPFDQKLAGAGAKEKAKLLKKQQNQKGASK